MVTTASRPTPAGDPPAWTWCSSPTSLRPATGSSRWTSHGSYLENTYSATNVVPLAAYCNASGKNPSKSLLLPVRDVDGRAGRGRGRRPAAPSQPRSDARYRQGAADAHRGQVARPAGQLRPADLRRGLPRRPRRPSKHRHRQQPGPQPQLGRDAGGNVGIVSASNCIWGTNIIWGTHVIWGTGSVYGTNIIWGTNVIWGTGSTFANGTLASSNHASGAKASGVTTSSGARAAARWTSPAPPSNGE